MTSSENWSWGDNLFWVGLAVCGFIFIGALGRIVDPETDKKGQANGAIATTASDSCLMQTEYTTGPRTCPEHKALSREACIDLNRDVAKHGVNPKDCEVFAVKAEHICKERCRYPMGGGTPLPTDQRSVMLNRLWSSIVPTMDTCKPFGGRISSLTPPAHHLGPDVAPLAVIATTVALA